MRSALRALLFLLAGAALAATPSAPPGTSPSAAPAPAAQRHPLRGVVVSVMTERSALLVKHEEIPGVMRAMTMLFRVDEATLKAAKKGQSVTGLMARENKEWWLHEVKLSDAPKG